MTRGGNSPEVRQAHLEEYILGCVRDGILSWQDILNGEAIDTLLRMIPSDVRTVVKRLSKRGAGGLLQIGGMLLGQLGQKLAEKK